MWHGNFCWYFHEQSTNWKCWGISSLVMISVRVCLRGYFYLCPLNPDIVSFISIPKIECLPLLVHTLKSCLIKREFKQSRSTILPISTKRTMTSNLKPLTTKRSRHVLRGKSMSWLGLGTQINVAGFNRLMGSQHYPCDNWSSSDNRETRNKKNIQLDSIFVEQVNARS